MGRTPAFFVASANAHQSAHAVGEAPRLVVNTSSSAFAQRGPARSRSSACLLR